MSIQYSNPWGKTADNNLQRDDLFIFDLGPVSQSISTTQQLSSVPGIENLPVQDSAWFYGSMVTMPARKTETVEILTGGTPRLVPGYILPPDGLKVEFLVDTEGSLAQSKIQLLLSAWRNLIRIGRPSPFGGPEILLPSATFKPVYRFDIQVYGFEGVTSLSQTYNVELNQALVTSHQWTLSKCWLVDHKVGTLNQENGLLKITANFACSSLIYAGGTGHSNPTIQRPQALGTLSGDSGNFANNIS